MLNSQLQKDAEFLEFNEVLTNAIRPNARRTRSRNTSRASTATFSEWEKRLEEKRVLQSKLDDANQEVKLERRAAGLSLHVSVGDSYHGDVTIKELRVPSVSRSMTAPARMSMTTIELRNYDLVDQERKITPLSTWIIVDIREQGD